jgi:hypothetical protein
MKILNYVITSLAVFVLSLLISGKAEAICFIDDVGCLASSILPNNQTSTVDVREWSAKKGYVQARGNTITFTFMLDEQSMETLKAPTIFGGYGMEVEVVEKDGHVLNISSIKHNLPALSNASQDTSALGIGDTPGTYTHALIIRNPEKLAKDVWYRVDFVFDKEIPSAGINIQPNLVISLDMNDIGIVCSFLPFSSLCQSYVENSSSLDMLEYYALETDSYSFFKAFPDGSHGISWTQKNASPVCKDLQCMNTAISNLIGSASGVFATFDNSPKVYLLSKDNNQLWWITNESTFYSLGGVFGPGKLLQYTEGVYKDFTSKYPISGSMTLIGSVLNTSTTSTVNLKSNDWTYDIGHAFQSPVYADSSAKIINSSGVEFTMAQAVDKGWIYKTAYLYSAGTHTAQNTTSMVLNPKGCYVVYAFVSGLRIVLSGSMDNDKTQSVVDMNTVAVADSRFVPYGFQSSFGSNPNWSTDFSLNRMAYPLVAGGHTWVNQAVSKTNKAVRYVCYRDPVSGLWSNWKRVY